MSEVQEEGGASVFLYLLVYVVSVFVAFVLGLGVGLGLRLDADSAASHSEAAVGRVAPTVNYRSYDDFSADAPPAHSPQPTPPPATLSGAGVGDELVTAPLMAALPVTTEPTSDSVPEPVAESEPVLETEPEPEPEPEPPLVPVATAEPLPEAAPKPVIEPEEATVADVADGVSAVEGKPPLHEGAEGGPVAHIDPQPESSPPPLERVPEVADVASDFVEVVTEVEALPPAGPTAGGRVEEGASGLDPDAEPDVEPESTEPGTDSVAVTTQDATMPSPTPATEAPVGAPVEAPIATVEADVEADPATEMIERPTDSAQVVIETESVPFSKPTMEETEGAVEVDSAPLSGAESASVAERGEAETLASGSGEGVVEPVVESAPPVGGVSGPDTETQHPVGSESSDSSDGAVETMTEDEHPVDSVANAVEGGGLTVSPADDSAGAVEVSAEEPAGEGTGARVEPEGVSAGDEEASMTDASRTPDEDPVAPSEPPSGEAPLSASVDEADERVPPSPVIEELAESTPKRIEEGGIAPPHGAATAVVEAETLYSLQIGSYRDPGNAQAVVGALRRDGHRPFIYRPAGGASRWHTVRIGAFESRAQADAAAARFKQSDGRDPLVIPTDSARIPPRAR